MNPPAGPTKARISGSKQAETRINEPHSRAGEKKGTGSTAPWKSPPGKAFQEQREGRKRAATDDLFTQVPNAIEGKIEL